MSFCYCKCDSLITIKVRWTIPSTRFRHPAIIHSPTTLRLYRQPLYLSLPFQMSAHAFLHLQFRIIHRHLKFRPPFKRLIIHPNGTFWFLIPEQQRLSSFTYTINFQLLHTLLKSLTMPCSSSSVSLLIQLHLNTSPSPPSFSLFYSSTNIPCQNLPYSFIQEDFN